MNDEERKTGSSFKMHAILLAFFLAAHFLIFYGLFSHFPSLIAGDSAIAREELIPIFNLKTQFLDQFKGQLSPLTSTDEIRVAYSFWTAWLKWFPVLPFAIIILNAISAWILFYSFYSFTRDFFKGSSAFMIFASVLGSLFIHLILLYSKITHFYTLIFGFSLFALSISLTLKQLFFRQRLQTRQLLFIAATILFNPAIHYHVLYYLVATAFFAAFSAISFAVRSPMAMPMIRKNALSFAVIFAASAIPYITFIWFITSKMSTSIGDSIPINYDVIYYASSNLSSIFSLTIPGHVDLYAYGTYSPESPRILGGLITLISLTPLLFFRWAHVPLRQSAAYLLLASGTIVSIWLSLGYAESYSFHSMIRGIISAFGGANNALAEAVNSLAYIIVQILRYPHRFTFILLYMVGILFTVSAVWWYEGHLATVRQRIMAYAAMMALFAFPFAANPDYRSTLFSGDFNGFLAPYAIPGDLKRIKSIVEETPSEKIFILPSLESGREFVLDAERFHFIDKFLIYYLDHPTYYYGAGAQTHNKISSFLVYRSLSYDDNSWESVLIDNLGISYILRPHISLRDKGFAYLTDIDGKLERALASSSRFERVYNGNDYSLYKARQPVRSDSLTYVNLDWLGTVTFLGSQDGTGGAYKFPLQTREFLRLAGYAPSAFMRTDNIERAFYDLYVGQTGIARAASSKRAPFSRDIVIGSAYTANTFSQFNLYSAENPYNTLGFALPALVNSETGQFIRFIDSSATIEFAVPETGPYRLLVRAASPNSSITASIDGTQSSFAKAGEGGSGDIVEFDYFTHDTALSAGTHTLSLRDTDENPVIFEFMSFIPKASLPEFSGERISSDGFDIVRADGDTYRFFLKK